MKKLSAIIISAIFAMSVFALPTKASEIPQTAKAGRVATRYTGLIVRSEASADSEILTSLKKDSYVTLLKTSGDWWQVEYEDGKIGYCLARYISEEDSQVLTVKITSGRLNIREGAGTDKKIIGTLQRNENVITLSTENGWNKVLFDGSKIGYVSSKYLGEKGISINLNVVSLKQNDSRWANVEIGTSGKTISQIGCTTTAIAMVESYRKGTVIRPDTMSKQLKYTSSGNVYWPSDYLTVTNSVGYLNGILEQLKKGKPVIFGSKTKYGSQHWVVIKGYEGNGIDLTANDFIINNPGSSNKSTLADHLSTHPVFYKYLYYK